MATQQSFIAAVTSGDTEAVKAQLRERPDLSVVADGKGTTAPLLALYHGHKALAATLADAKQSLTIWEAVALGQLLEVASQLAADSDVADAFAPDGFTPLGLAAYFGHPEIVLALLDAGADPNLSAANAASVQPLHSAVAHGKNEAALRNAILLLASGADVNARQRGGWTPLHQAAHHGDLEMVLLLLRYGADPTAKSEDGRTAREMADEEGYTRVAAAL